MDDQFPIEVCFSPAMFPLYKAEEAIVVVIDILRATSSICVAFENGAGEMIPVAKVEDCIPYKDKGYLIAGERGGVMLDGFDFGNSPFSYMNEAIRGKKIAITTTNGTQAIEAAKGSYKVAIGSFLNIDSLVNWLKTERRPVICLCSGWKNKYNMEDSLFAGALSKALINTGLFFTDCDASLSCQHLFEIAQHDVFGFLGESSHRKRLKRLNIEKDIEFCLMRNLTRVVPVLEGNKLINLKSGVTA